MQHTTPSLAALAVVVTLLCTACQTDTGWLVHADEPAEGPRLCHYPLREAGQLAEPERAEDAPPPPPAPDLDEPPVEAVAATADPAPAPDEANDAATASTRSRTRARPRPRKREREPEPSPSAAADCVDLNTASEAQLQRLPGVGASRAARIVAQRTRRPFTKPSQIQRVKGVGKATYRRLAAQLCPM